MKDVGVNGGDGAGQEDEKEEVIKSGNTCEVEPRIGGRGYISRGYSNTRCIQLVINILQ